MARIGVLVVSAVVMTSVLAAQQDAATRRLARVPAPVGADGGVQDLYSASYALLVGVDRYDDAAAWAPLDSVTSELSEMKSTLLSLGFNDVLVVTNPSGAELRRSVEDFIGRYGYETGARLLFLFSGHGHTLDNGARGYFVPRDAPDPSRNEIGFRRSALSMDLVATWARDITAKHALFAFDSCFSGTIFRTRERTVPQPITNLTAKKVRAFLSAGSAGEPVPARSVFAPTLVRGLRGEADLNRDGFVTGTELGNWVQARVIEYRTRQTPQFGKLRDPEFDEGDLVFAVATARSAASSNTAPAGAVTPVATDLALAAELALWDATKDSRSVATVEEYLKQYPNGRFRVAAQERLQLLRPPLIARSLVIEVEGPEALLVEVRRQLRLLENAGVTVRLQQSSTLSIPTVLTSPWAGIAISGDGTKSRRGPGRGAAVNPTRCEIDLQLLFSVEPRRTASQLRENYSGESPDDDQACAQALEGAVGSAMGHILDYMGGVIK